MSIKDTTHQTIKFLISCTYIMLQNIIRFCPLNLGKIKYWDVSVCIETKLENRYIYQDC